MRTIFHANRKSLDSPRFVIVYRYGGHLCYVPLISRERRQDWEGAFRDEDYRLPLYRVNVYPKKSRG